LTDVTWVGDDNAAVLTDLYEITMAAAYLADGFDHEATFELWVRSLPEERSFLVAAGLDTALTYLERLRFSPDAIDYLGEQRHFTTEFRERLASLRFTGTVHALPEGTIAFSAEPLIRVTAPLIEAQIVETFLLNAVGFQTMIASKAARVRLACEGRRFVDFGGRRAHGADAALKGARAAFIGGASSTSIVLAGKEYGIPIVGTMAHSFILAHPNEAAAFRSFARTFRSDDTVLLLDTYDTVAGARIAAEAITELADEGIAVGGVRLDSGDLGGLATTVREILDDAGHTGVTIFASGGLDEHRIADLVRSGAPIDGFGVGTSLATSEDAPSLDIVYKLVADRGEPRMKTSTGKVTLPGIKQVFRSSSGDVIGLADEQFDGHTPLIEPVMIAGERTAGPPTVVQIRERAIDAIDALPDALTGLDPADRAAWPVTVSDALQGLADRMTGAR
jgi:nicotinate phosphoribosyltransferase